MSTVKPSQQQRGLVDEISIDETKSTVMSSMISSNESQRDSRKVRLTGFAENWTVGTQRCLFIGTSLEVSASRRRWKMLTSAFENSNSDAGIRD